jgi:hypothetical protein
MNAKLKKWVGFDFWNNRTFEKPPREGTDESDEMKQFFRDIRSDLKKSLAEKDIIIHRLKPNYYDVNAVVTDGNGKFAYISLGDMRGNVNWNQRILIRTMKHEKDWTGGANHFVNYDDIPEQILWLWR